MKLVADEKSDGVRSGFLLSDISEVMTMENSNLESVLDRAIKNEEEAFLFYMDLCDKVEDREAKDTLRFLAREEEKHKEYLTRYRSGLFKENILGMGAAINNEIAEHLYKPDIEKDMSSKDIYLVAANRELNSYRFYLSLAEIHPAGEVKDLLLKMAAEEMKHKEKMEYLYVNTAFPQTAGG
jgi:rubrerythrin